MPDGSRTKLIATERFFRRIPPAVAATFTPDQIQAISRAVHRTGRPPPVNIRITVPLLFGRFYLAIIAGREKRSRQRLREERAVNPLSTFGNFVFVIVAAILFYAAVAALMTMYAAGTF